MSGTNLDQKMEELEGMIVAKQIRTAIAKLEAHADELMGRDIVQARSLCEMIYLLMGDRRHKHVEPTFPDRRFQS